MRVLVIVIAIPSTKGMGNCIIEWKTHNSITIKETKEGSSSMGTRALQLLLGTATKQLPRWFWDNVTNVMIMQFYEAWTYGILCVIKVCIFFSNGVPRTVPCTVQ
jgi:hypothetical protein